MTDKKTDQYNDELEGIVAKLKDSKYVGRRSDAWLKMIN